MHRWRARHVGRVYRDRRVNVATRHGQISELGQLDGIGQRTIAKRLKRLVRPGRDHADRAIGEQLQSGKITGGV